MIEGLLAPLWPSCTCTGADTSGEKVKALGSYEDFLPAPITTDSHFTETQGRIYIYYKIIPC